MESSRGGNSCSGSMMIDPRSLEHLTPSQFISFTFPNPNSNPSAAQSHQSNSNNYNPYPHPLLRIAVLDSPIISSSHQPPVVAAMLVPVGREHDWIFSTKTGHLHLLLSSPCSRLILVGDLPSEPLPKPKPYTRSISHPHPHPDPGPDSVPDPVRRFQTSILSLLHALSPKSAFTSGVPHIPFLSYHDDVARIVPVDHLVGPVVGEMLVEDVELDGGESRRRLRFKRMPNLVQSQVRGLTNTALNAAGGTFRPETGSLVQPYLGPMVAGLSLLAPDLLNMKALCLGVGGGDLLMCLRHRFGFNVVGVEADDVVLRVAKCHFGLIEDEWLAVVVGDGIELMESRNKEFLDGFDVIMVDLDSGDALSGISAPPVEFVKSSVLFGARLALREKGIMVVNVIPPNECFYKRLVDCLRKAFAELYEIDVGNGENYVLIAAASPAGPVGKENNGPFLEKFKKLGVDRFLDCINKI